MQFYFCAATNIHPRAARAPLHPAHSWVWEQDDVLRTTCTVEPPSELQESNFPILSYEQKRKIYVLDGAAKPFEMHTKNTRPVFDYDDWNCGEQLTHSLTEQLND